MKPAPDIDAIRKRLAGMQGKEAWRSLEELADTEEFKEFLHKEFPRETTWGEGINRRSFLKLLAAPLALAGLSACVPQPGERILPYTNAPEDLLPGKPLFYATAMEMDGYGQGLLVESNYGRPTKVEGNPDHPASLGATDAFAQASVLTLFDPDRAQVITSGGQIRTWEAFSALLSAAIQSQQGSGGAGLRILSGTVTSPTLASQVRALLQQFPNAVWYQYDPVGRDNVRQGASQAFGQPVESRYRFERANVILSLDDNFVMHEPGRLRYLRDFASRRQAPEGSGGMNRLYVIESTYTTLGGFADHRLPMQASQVEIFARALAARLGIRTPGEFQMPRDWVEWLDALAEDLQANQGTGLVLVGPQQPPVVHALGHAMNAALGNVGQTVSYTDPVEAFPVDQTANLVELARELQAGRVDLLVVLDGNPVYTAPADLNFSEAFRKSGLSVYLGLYEDETADLASWHIPAAHFLEMWGDTRAFDGTTTIIQPLIEPLYGGKSPHELIAALLGQPDASGYDIVRAFWQSQLGGAGAAPTPSGSTPAMGETPATPGGATPSSPVTTPASPAASSSSGTPGAAGGPAPATTGTAGGNTGQANQAGGPTANPAEAAFERTWRQALRDGMIPNTGLPERQVTLQVNFEALIQNSPASPESLEILFEPDPSIWDGRFASNAWLQELPKPVTKLTWDNAALVSPGTADRLGISNEDVVELHYKGRVVEAPVWILPGQPDGTVTVHLGYGKRAGASEVVNQDNNPSGFNAYALRTSDAPWFGTGLEIQKTRRRYPLATTQQHFNMEGRDLAKAGTLDEYRANPHFAQETELLPGEEEGHPPSFYPEYEYNGHAWGMAINLGSCIGCNACVVACQAENNIPVVGKDQVKNSREMHWLRIDTYFVGGLENPETRFQPLLCMHCEKAPCEPVCPVEATVHSSEGLNEMVYNRCVGTRYCSNNCPYKVRRFNFLQYSNDNSIPLRMLHNPDVTVRSRGVMEKCTYCVQRINAGRVEAEVSGRPLQDGEVVTACQQACPTRAIVFGDLNDPNSAVRRLKGTPLNFDLLAELGTQPRTSYLAKLKNPNPRLKA